MNYKDTLQLPQTPFAMRANLGQKEPEMLARWAEQDLWGSIEIARAGGTPYVLHDGPPYANGALHHGHILNKVLKDLIIKDRTMAGFAVSYVPGWDCHGLPIEAQVDKELGSRKASMLPQDIIVACRAYAEGQITSQRAAFMRLGVQGTWDRPYRTMDAAYEAQTMRELARLMEGELIYKSLRPVHWCTVHQTALAEAEVEYAERVSPSVYVAMRAHKTGALSAIEGALDFVIWTTTPWSLPGNVAIALHPEVTYVVVQSHSRKYVVAQPLLESFMAAQTNADLAATDGKPDIEAHFLGADLAGETYAHPFLPRDGVVVTDTFVATDAGTGCVHMAPGHGVEDFVVAQRLGLEVLSPVDARGVMMEAAGPYAGLKLAEATTAIVADLAAAGSLLSDPTRTTTHRYAHCWRCHKPVITRATEQWFMAMDRPFAGGGTLRERSLAALREVKWVPAWGVERIGGMLKGRPDWCLSRQRTWGVPIPIVYCRRCDAPFRSPEHMRRVADRVETAGAGIWHELDVQTLFGDIACRACGHAGTDAWRKETDILDVWFDSGVSYAAVLEARNLGPSDGPPADLYLEGSDQHRGWFHSSLLTSLATRERPPYRNVLTHGFVVDGQGRKISKSVGNFVDPFASIAQDGAELWRLWVAAEDCQNDVRISPAIMRQLADSYRKVRNTLRFLLGNLHDFNPSTDAVAWDALTELDQWAIADGQDQVRGIREAFAAYNFHTGLQRLLSWCSANLSAFYLDVLKDRLYADAARGPARRAAQTALWMVAQDLLRMMAPIFCFTAEEAWGLLPHLPGAAHSVHLAQYPGGDDGPMQAAVRHAAAAAWPQLDRRFGQVQALRRQILVALEQARQNKVMGSSVAAAVTLSGDDAARDALAGFDLPAWADLAIVSQMHWRQEASGTPLRIEVAHAEGDKCPRCWLYRLPAGVYEAQDPKPQADAVCARCTEALS